MKQKKFNESVAANCRYGDLAESIWGDWDLVWERSCDDYQGSANFLIHKNGKFVAYQWDYGSCSGCDTWEAAEMSVEQVVHEMKRDAITMTVAAAKRWVQHMPHDDQREELHKFLALCEWDVPLPPSPPDSFAI